MKRFLLAAAAVVLVAGPALAQPQPDQNNRDHRSAAPTRAPVARPDRPAGQPFNRGPATGAVHTYGGPMPAGERFNSRNPGAAGPAQRFAPGYANPNRNYAPQNGARQQFPGSDHHMVNGQDRFRTPGQRGDFRAQGQRGDWRGQDRRGDWRGQDRRGDWRGRGERGQGWWRGQRGFERYEGRRDGFWFAPGYGYYRPDPRWYGYDWEIGVSVPYELRSYYISDPYAYDLPPAPYGCAWIYLGNELVMIDVQSGQIVQIAGQY